MQLCSDLTPATVITLINALDSLVEQSLELERNELYQMKDYAGDGYMVRFVHSPSLTVTDRNSLSKKLLLIEGCQWAS